MAATAVVVTSVAVRLLVSLVVDPDPFHDGWLVYRRSTEAGIALVVCIWATRGLPLRWFEEAMGRGRLTALGLVVFFMAVTQYTTLFGTQYPFSAWTMYGRPAVEARYPVVSIERADGRTDRVALAEVLPSVTPRPFAATLLVLASARSDEPQRFDALTRTTVRSLGERAGAGSGDHVVFEVCTVRDPRPDRLSTCSIVVRVPVDQPEELE
ncbi:MAG: hypothetical protein ACXIVQ_04355 [Acidimicrobiales bacterium]